MNNKEQNKIEPRDFLRFLKASAHHVKPTVQVGKQGMTDNVIDEVKNSLLAHELMKVGFLPKQKANMNEACEIIVNKTGALLVKQQGCIATFFLAKEKDSRFIFKTK